MTVFDYVCFTCFMLCPFLVAFWIFKVVVLAFKRRVMSDNLSSKKLSRAVSEFFLKVLESHDEPIYYDRLRGYASSSRAEIKKFVKKHCRGEDLLTFLKRRSVVFNVTFDNYVEIKGRNKKRKTVISDDENTESTKPSTESMQIKQRKKIPSSRSSRNLPPSSNNANSLNRNSQGPLSSVDDNPWKLKSSSESSALCIWEQQPAVDEIQLEEEALQYFKECFHSKPFPYHQLKYYALPRNVKAYLKLKYPTHKIHRFLLDYCNIFSVDDDGYVTIVEVSDNDNEEQNSPEDLNKVFENDSLSEGKEETADTKQQLQEMAGAVNKTPMVNSHSIDVLSRSEKLKPVSQSAENSTEDFLSDVDAEGVKYFSEQPIVSDNKKHSKQEPKKRRKTDMIIANGNEYSRNQQFMNHEDYENGDSQETTGTSLESALLDSAGDSLAFITLSSQRSNTIAYNKNSNSSETAQCSNKKPKKCCKNQHKNHDSLLVHDEVHRSLTNSQSALVDDLRDGQDFQLLKELSAIQYFVKIMKNRQKSPILIERIRGHLAQAPKEAFDYVKVKFRGHHFKKFFTRHPKIFFVNKQEVQLANGYELQLQKMRESTDAISQTKSDLEEISNSLSAHSSALHSDIQVEDLIEDEMMVKETPLSENVLLPSISICFKNESLTRLEISGGFTPNSIFTVEIMSVFHYSHYAEFAETVDLLSSVSFARSLVWGHSRHFSKKKFCKLYSLRNISKLNQLRLGTFMFDAFSISDESFWEDVIKYMLSMQADWSVNEDKWVDALNADFDNAVQLKVNCAKVLESKKITAYSEKSQSETSLETIMEEEEEELPIEHIANTLPNDNNAEANISPANSISKIDHLLYEDSIGEYEAESECTTISSNDDGRSESDFTVKMSNEDMQENVTEDNDLYCNDDIWTETPDDNDGSFGKWDNNENDLVENMGSAIQTPCSQYSTDIKGTKIITTIYDRDYEIVEQQKILENFPTYFCRFICSYIVQEHKEGDSNEVEGKIEDLCNCLQLSHRNNASATESDIILSFPGVGSHHSLLDIDSEEPLIKENDLNIEKNDEVNTKMDSLPSSLDGTIVSGTEYFSASPNDFTTILSKDDEDKVLLGEESLVNIPSFKIYNESLKSLVNGEIRNGYACDLKKAIDTLKFPLYEDDTTMPRDVINEDNGFIFKDPVEEDVTISKDAAEGDVTILKDSVKEDVTILKDSAEEDVTVSKDPTEEEDIPISKDVTTEQDVTTSKDALEGGDTILHDLVEKEEITVLEDSVGENVTSLKYVVEQDVIIPKDVFEENVTISKDPTEEGSISSNNSVEEDVLNYSIDSQTSLTQNSDGFLTSDTEYLSYSPPRIVLAPSLLVCDNDSSPVTEENQISVISDGISSGSNHVRNSVKTIKDCDRVNIGNKNKDSKLPAYEIVTAPKDLQKVDKNCSPYLSDSNTYEACDTSNLDRNKIEVSGFCGNDLSHEDKSDLQPLNSIFSSTEFIESGFASALSMNSREKMGKCSSDTMTDSIIYEKPIDTKFSTIDDGTNMCNSQEEAHKSTIIPGEDAILPLNTIALLSKGYVMDFYAHVILLTKGVCIAKSIENGLPIFCSSDFFKCHKHKTGLDACFSALTIGDVVCCSVLTPSPDTNIMTCCQFSNAGDVEGKSDPFLYHNPHEMRSVAVQTQYVIQCKTKAEEALDERKDSSCQTISTGEILLTKCLFPNTL